MERIRLALLRTKSLQNGRLGLIRNVMKLPRLNGDPYVTSFGIIPANTLSLGGEKFEGRSSGCGRFLNDGYLRTIGETVERYCPAFYKKEDMRMTCYKELTDIAINPKEFALFHERQYNEYVIHKYKIVPFGESTKLHWTESLDLTDGKSKLIPSAFVYLPWTGDDQWITVGTSTGLAAHTNYYKAILTALYELIERDAFVVTWHQQMFKAKIWIDDAIHKYIANIFPNRYEWHFMDITYDFNVPTVFGICFGRAEFGDFVAVGTATRTTYGDALRKVILEIAQSVSYFRFLLDRRRNWMPNDNFRELLNFEDHSIFYIKRPELQTVFDVWRKAEASFSVDIEERNAESTEKQITTIIERMRQKGYNVLVKDLTTSDVNQVGLYAIRIVIPQLLQMGGAYPFYFLGGRRLYDLPVEMGMQSKSFEQLNHYPHPFP